MAASKPTEERFFAQLKRLAAVLDKQLPVLQEQVINPPENTAVHQLRAKKTIAELRSDVKTVKVCIITFEQQHDKTNKMTHMPSKDSDQPGHSPSLISLCCPHEETLGP